MDFMKIINEMDGGKKEKFGKVKFKEERLCVQLFDRKDFGKWSFIGICLDVWVFLNVLYVLNYLEMDFDDE